MIDLNYRKPQKKKDEPSAELIIGAVIVFAFWAIWAFLIGGML